MECDTGILDCLYTCLVIIQRRLGGGVVVFMVEPSVYTRSGRLRLVGVIFERVACVSELAVLFYVPWKDHPDTSKTKTGG